MKKNGLNKFYDRLTPEERFQLFVDAEARGDKKESWWLVRSAPRYTYTPADPAYTRLVRASKDLTFAGYAWTCCRAFRQCEWLELLPRSYPSSVRPLPKTRVLATSPRSEREPKGPGGRPAGSVTLLSRQKATARRNPWSA